MVVDDDADIRQALGNCLGSEGYDVELCADGRDAIERLDLGCSPEVIVLDLAMPRMNGLQVLEALKADPRWSSIPVVVVAGNRPPSAEVLGVWSVLWKPFELHDLVAALKAAGEQSRGSIRSDV